MKLRAMPASVERSAARGVALRTRSATNAAASSMTPESSVARSPACHAMRAGSGSPAAFGERLGRQHDEKHVGEERDRVDAVRQGADVRAPRTLGEPPGLDGVGDVADEDRDRRRRQHAAVDEIGREPEHAPAQRVDEQQLNEIVEGEPEKAIDVTANDPTHAGEDSSCLRHFFNCPCVRQVQPAVAAVDGHAHPGTVAHLPDRDRFLLAARPRDGVAGAASDEGGP